MDRLLSGTAFTRHSKRWAITVALSAFLIPNVVIGFLSSHYGGFRPLVNLDFCLPVLAMLWSRNWLASLAFVVFVAEDLVLSFLPLFSLRTDFLWVSMVFFDGVSFLRKSLVLICGLLCVGAFLGIRQIVHVLVFGMVRRRTGALALAAMLCLVVLADALNGTSFLMNSDRTLLSLNIASSPTFRIAKMVLDDRGRTATFRRLHDGESATFKVFNPARADAALDLDLALNDGLDWSALFSEAGSHSGPFPQDANFVLVMVESLGCLLNDPGRSNLFRPLLGLTNRYEFSAGTIRSTGATVAGEMRELCWAYRISGKIKDPPSFSLVHEFADRGFHTSSFHGFYKTMFSRDLWYPKLGFKHSVFLEDMLATREPVPLRGVAFQGATDQYVAGLVKAGLLETRNAGDPKFVYWLTLSSHLPVDEVYARELGIGWLQSPLASAPSAIVNHEAILAGVIRDVTALASDPRLGASYFLVVGDHPPPFVDPSLRAQYELKRVPYLFLRPLKETPASAPDR